MTSKFAMTLLLALAVFSFPAVTLAQVVALDATLQVGGQAWTGPLGTDFDVVVPIQVTALGVFDSGGDGFANTLTVGIFDRSTSTLITSRTFVPGTTGTLINGSRFLPLPAPVTLLPGQYSIVGAGFGASDPNGNTAFGNTAPALNTGGGLITFAGLSRRYDNAAGLYLPTITPDPNQYLAGTFQFIEAPFLTQVGQFANVGVPGDNQLINLTSVTGTPAPGAPANTGNICVHAYAFDQAEEMISCCSCEITPHGLKTISIKNDILTQTLTPGTPSSISVVLLATTKVPNVACNPGDPLQGRGSYSLSLRAWRTTVHAGTVAGAYQVVEGSMLDGGGPVGPNPAAAPGVLANNVQYCNMIKAYASGYGICKSCQLGAFGGQKK